MTSSLLSSVTCIVFHTVYFLFKIICWSVTHWPILSHLWKWKFSQSSPTLCDPMVYTIHGIIQARILEWVAFLFSRGSSPPKDQTWVSCIAGRFFTSWVTRDALCHLYQALTCCSHVLLERRTLKEHDIGQAISDGRIRKQKGQISVD